MALYCNGIGCKVKENCYRYTELKNKIAKGEDNGVWTTCKSECDTDRDFFYVKRDEDYENEQA